MNQGNLGLFDTLYAPNVVDRNAQGTRTYGQASIRNTLIEVRMLLPDLLVEVDSLHTEGDTVIIQERWRGTHASTGKPVQGTISHLFRVRHHRIIEEWSGGWDWLILLLNTSTPPAE